MNKVVLIVVVVLLLSVVAVAQPSNLTDRELLVQLYTKVDSIERAMNKVAYSAEIMQTSIVLLDKRVSANETSIKVFCDKIDDMGLRWNALLALFATFILGLFAWMWKRVYTNRGNGREVVK